jgi:hypothetical protein
MSGSGRVKIRIQFFQSVIRNPQSYNLKLKHGYIFLPAFALHIPIINGFHRYGGVSKVAEPVPTIGAHSVCRHRPLKRGRKLL